MSVHIPLAIAASLLQIFCSFCLAFLPDSSRRLARICGYIGLSAFLMSVFDYALLLLINAQSVLVNICLLFFFSWAYVTFLCGGVLAFCANKKAPAFLSALSNWISVPLSYLYGLFRWPDLSVHEEVREEDIRALIEEASSSEEIEAPQKELLDNVFELDDTNIEEICTHRSEVVFIERDESLENWQKIIHENRHTFYPIIGEDEDDVVGILDTRDYFRLDQSNKEELLLKAVDSPLFVSENTKVDHLFHEMKKHRTYFAVVLDEYGGMTGIVTLHDIVETLLGEMQEEDEPESSEEIIELPDGRFKISGSADLEEVEEALHLSFDTEEYDTFGGYVLGMYGHIPADGIMNLLVELNNVTIRIREIKNHRISLMIVEKKEGEKHERAEKSDS
jgi:putative hemolysin